MRASITRKGGLVAAGSAAVLAAGIFGSGVAHAAPGDGGPLSFSISNPITASLSLSSDAVHLVSAGTGANLSQGTDSPHVTDNIGGGQSYSGGIEVAVESDAPNGYSVTLNGGSPAITGDNGAPNVDYFNMNVDAYWLTTNGAAGAQHTTSNHFVTAPGTDPLTNGVQLMNTTAASGTLTDAITSGGSDGTPVDSTTGLTPDTIQTAYFVQPKSGMLPGHNYVASATFTYLAK